jgi:hypothetical protein
MKKRLAIWLTSLSVFVCIAIARTPPCEAGPVLTTPTSVITEEKFQVVFVARGKKPTTTIANDKLKSGSLENPIVDAVDGNGADAYFWIVNDVSGTAAEQLRGRDRPRYETVRTDIHSANYWRDATKHKSNASEDRLDMISAILKIAAEVAENSRFRFPIICGSRGHFP